MRLTTPVAIVIAGALIGVGLFLGLRGRPVPQEGAPAAPAPESVEPSNSIAPTTDARAKAAPTIVALSSSADAGDAAQEVLRALNVHRKRVVDECVTPAMVQQPQPPTIKLKFQYAFGADGKQVGRGVQEDRATGRPEVTRCILERIPLLQIEPRGVVVTADTVWVLP